MQKSVFHTLNVRLALHRLTVMGLFLLAFMGLDAAVNAQIAVSLDEAVKNLAVGIEDKLEKETKIVILDVKSTSERLSNHIIDELTALLINSGKLIVVDRKNLDLINEEMKFQMSGEVSDESMQSIGHKLGAQSIISGTGEDRGDHYRLSFRTLEVVSARVQSLLTQNVNKNDSSFVQLTQGRVNLSTRKFTFGGTVGVSLLGVYSLDDIKEDYHEPDITPLTNFALSLYAAYNISSLLAIQAELSVMINNGIAIDGIDLALYDEGAYDDNGNPFDLKWNECKINDVYTYTSLELPILIRFNLKPVPALLIGILVGPYISLPLGGLKNEFSYPNFAQNNDARDDKIANMPFGVLAGVTVGYNLGLGYITAGMRFLNDFTPITANYEGGFGGGERTMFTRRVFSVSLGYEVWF
jgi:TolB-like protein